MANSRALGSSEWWVSSQVPPPLWQNLAAAHSAEASSNLSDGPSIICACCLCVFLLAVSVPLNLTFPCVPSQKGLFLDSPHRHSAQGCPAGTFLPWIHSSGSFSFPIPIICLSMGRLPLTR